MKKLLFFLVMISMVFFLAACNNDGEETENTQQENTEEPAPLEFSDEERVADDTSVVRVNEEEIKGDKYNQIYTQVKTMLYSYGQDASDTEAVKDQTMNILVEQELINQDAEKLGIEVTEEEAQQELDKMKEETGDEQFQQVLDTYQVTEDQLKKQLQDDLVTVKYMQEQFDTEVTDEEIEEYYNQLKEQNPEVGELEDMKEDIRSLLERQKQSEQLATKVAELKEAAEIEQLI